MAALEFLNSHFFSTILYTQLLCSVIWTGFLGICAAIAIPIKEKWIRRGMLLVSLLAMICSFMMTFKAPLPLLLETGTWFNIAHYEYEISFYLTTTTAWFATLSSFLFCSIATFSGSYLHRDPGYLRFFLLVALAQLGVYLVCFSRSGDLLFFGWELVGIGSVLLISFFQNHHSASRQSVKAMVNYRIADAFLIVALLLLHHMKGNSHLDHIDSSLYTHHWKWELMSFCFIIGSLAKAGQFPFINWLPRAMEGPTPSSALFYGAISVHLGPLLLLRTSPIWVECGWLKILVFLIGGLTSTYSTLVGRTQANVKGQLAYAVMGQIGLILIEISLNLQTLAVIHISGHALLRTWQYLRASSFIQDLNESRELYEWFRAERFNYLEAYLPPKWERWLYPHAVQGFHWSSFEKWLLVSPLFWFANLIKGRK